MEPFLKWAGGKRWLRAEIARRFPNWTGRYIEPFLGSGAIFFHLKPSSALLSDINSKLIETYIAMRDRPDLVERYLRGYQALHSDDFYYEERPRSHRSQARRAAQFIYLNRTCWNGLYRVNKKGDFNVPRGTKNAIMMPGEDFRELSKLLTCAEICCDDFETIIDRADHGDLVYCDPPYTIHHNMNGFLKYNENIFSWQDQLRLHAAVARAAERGAVVLVSNAGHESVVNLYNGLGETEEIRRASVISGLKKGRGWYDEILVEISG